MRTLVYPNLPSAADIGAFRLGGAGLGNCLFTYFYAVTLAEQAGARVIAPGWPSLNIGPILRGERSKRGYWGLFKPAPDEIAGLGKYLTLLGHGRAHRVELHADAPSGLAAGRLNLAHMKTFGFEGLLPHRHAVRSRFLRILRKGVEPSWGQGRYFAAHIRMGDFVPGAKDQLESGLRTNLRLPLSWYGGLIEQLRVEHPDIPVRIYSDGHAHELAEILAIPGTMLVSGGSDVDDLLGLAGAAKLITSQSTYSGWAVFLGDMENYRLETTGGREVLTTEDRLTKFVAL